MKNEELTNFGNEALYNGRNYTFANPKLTKEQRNFANYLFSDLRKTIVTDAEKSKTVQPEDLKAYKDHFVEANKKVQEMPKVSEKPKDKPTEKPKESQK